jgi:nucleotide-binding universal stress UspA family protein
LSSDDSVEDIVRKAALHSFLEATRLDEHPDRPDFLTSEAGSYAILLHQIEMFHLRAPDQAGGPLTISGAAGIWYDDHYLPVVELLRRRNLLKHYPQRTETDLYVWVLENHQALLNEFGWGVPLETIAADLADRKQTGGRLQRMVRTAANPEQGTGSWRERRLSVPAGKMFSDIVVVLDVEEPSGPAFKQALRIAAEETAHLLGLWIQDAVNPDDAAFTDVQEMYGQECRAADVFGQLARGRGERSELVQARARWADLLVLQSSRGRAPSRALQQVLAGVFIPVWIARREEKRSSRVLLAYDGSPKADEALFLTAYMGALWGFDVSVLTVAEAGAPENVQDHAREYLDSFNIAARYLSARPPVPEAILAAAANEGAGLLATGSVHTNRLGRASLGPTLDRLLTDSPVPLLICR